MATWRSWPSSCVARAVVPQDGRGRAEVEHRALQLVFLGSSVVVVLELFVVSVWAMLELFDLISVFVDGWTVVGEQRWSTGPCSWCSLARRSALPGVGRGRVCRGRADRGAQGLVAGAPWLVGSPTWSRSRASVSGWTMASRTLSTGPLPVVLLGSLVELYLVEWVVCEYGVAAEELVAGERLYALHLVVALLVGGVLGARYDLLLRRSSMAAGTMALGCMSSVRWSSCSMARRSVSMIRPMAILSISSVWRVLSRGVRGHYGHRRREGVSCP